MKKRNNKRIHKVIDSRIMTPGIIEYAAKAFPILGSKSAVKKAIANGHLLINGKPANHSATITKGDILQLSGTGIRKVKKMEIPLEVVYEDDALIVINKPGGIAVNGNRNKTVENALADINKNNRQADALSRPIAVHRIDVPTTGLVILAKTKAALINLSKAFQENKVKKEYIAVVHGKPLDAGLIEEPIDGKRAITNFEKLYTVPSRVFDNLSLLKLQPVTGRTHQLRIHLKNMGHFIVGDKMYAEGKKTILGKGVLLCACKLHFPHPINGKPLTIQIDPPAKFEKILQRERERYLH
ncbi:MAG: RluA family pseudouridine synthase [Bacteroidetes bacterium]|nr:RluA family pseudouridine synthase [Bacteroidota bacterium]